MALNLFNLPSLPQRSNPWLESGRRSAEQLRNLLFPQRWYPARPTKPRTTVTPVSGPVSDTGRVSRAGSGSSVRVRPPSVSSRVLLEAGPLPREFGKPIEGPVNVWGLTAKDLWGPQEGADNVSNISNLTLGSAAQRAILDALEEAGVSSSEFFQSTGYGPFGRRQFIEDWARNVFSSADGSPYNPSVGVPGYGVGYEGWNNALSELADWVRSQASGIAGRKQESQSTSEAINALLEMLNSGSGQTGGSSGQWDDQMSRIMEWLTGRDMGVAATGYYY